MGPTHVFILVVLLNGVSTTITTRDGFKAERKQWTSVINKPLEDAKELILAEYPGARFVVHPLDLFERIPEEGYLNKIILGVSSDGTVVVPAKYFGYVPDMHFSETLIGKEFLDAVEMINGHVPSCQIVVSQDDKVIHTCCGGEFLDYIKVEVDSNGVVQKTPEFVITY